MRITIALEERDIETFAKYGCIESTLRGAYLAAQTALESGLESMFSLSQVNEDEMRVLKLPLARLYQSIKAGVNGEVSSFELDGSDLSILRKWASVQRTLNASLSLCHQLLQFEAEKGHDGGFTVEVRESITQTRRDLSVLNPVLDRLHYRTRSVIWIVEGFGGPSVAVEADRFDIKLVDGAWYVFEEGKQWSTIGHATEWQAIDELRAVKPFVGRFVEARHMAVGN